MVHISSNYVLFSFGKNIFYEVNVRVFSQAAVYNLRNYIIRYRESKDKYFYKNIKSFDLIGRNL